MNKSEINLNALKVWSLLVNNSRWSYNELKKTSGFRDKELGAALGWLAKEEKVEFDQERDDLYVYLSVNIYIG